MSEPRRAPRMAGKSRCSPTALGHVVMLQLVPECAGHAAASAVDLRRVLDRLCNCVEHAQRRRRFRSEGFLMTVPVIEQRAHC